MRLAAPKRYARYLSNINYRRKDFVGHCTNVLRHHPWKKLKESREFSRYEDEAQFYSVINIERCSHCKEITKPNPLQLVYVL